MRALVLTAVLATIASFCTLASAQQTGKPEVPTASHPQSLASKSQGAAQRAAGPSAELQGLIKALSGKWSLEVKFEPSAKMPNGVTLSGEETWRSGPGGFTLLEDERLPTPEGDIFLLGIIWWDNRTQRLQGMECNNQFPFTCDLKSALNDITMTWDGRQFAIEEAETHNGKKTGWHEVWSDITAKSFTQTGEIEEPDGSRNRFFTIHAKKVGNSPE